ncbi:3-oxoadipate enol-lactonase [soil metagenome]
MNKTILVIEPEIAERNSAAKTFLETTIALSDGEQIHLFEMGEGAPLFVLHGWSGTHERNRTMMAELAKHYRVVAWDARGHGTHAYRTTTPVTLEQLADDLHEALNALGLSRLSLIGHSMGGALSWQYMRKYGQGRIDKSVILDMTPRLSTDQQWRWGVQFDFPPARQAALIEAMQNDLPETILKLGASGGNEATRQLYEANDLQIQLQRSYFKSLNPRPIIELWQSLVAQDFRDFLTGLNVPTLLIYGGVSQYYGKELADWMHATLPCSRLYFMPQADHSPQIMFPMEVARAIRDFLMDAK